MENTVQKLREYYLAGNTRPYRYRIEKLRLLKKSIQRHRKDLLQALAQDLGKGETESELTEIGIVLSEISLFEKRLRRFMRPVRTGQSLATMPSKNRIYPEPYGVCLLLAPWNYPFQLSLMPLVGAVAAGNVCVLRCSSQTKETAHIIRRIIRDCFTEEECVALEDNDSYDEVLAPRYDFIFFTGSASTGKQIQKTAARHLTPIVLELGGKSPAIVDKTAHLPSAARRIVFGKMLNAGQTCIAPDYLLVEEEIREAFTEALKKEFTRQVKDAVQNGDLPRIINDRQFDRLQAYIDAHPSRWGGWYSKEHRLIQPALFYSVKRDDPVMQEEIFGPILPILSYTDFDAMLQALQREEKPLSLYFFSRKKRRIDQLLHTISFGGGCINDTMMHNAHPGLPFGGVGYSGMGAYHGKHSFDTFSHQKAVLSSPVYLHIPIRYRPYADWKKKWIRRILR